MVIVEGPDGAGKTTLIRRLTLERGWAVGERGTADRTKLFEVTVKDTMRALRIALKGDVSPPVIWDRLYFSDLVYAPIQNRPIAFHTREQMLIESVLHSLQAPIILCMPPWETVRDNEEGTVQMDAVHENLHAIYDAYAGEVIRPKFFTYDYTRGEQAMFDLNHYLDMYVGARSNRQWFAPIGNDW